MIGGRVQAAIEASLLQIENKTVPMTVSVGIANIINNRDSADDSLERADTERYRAKAKDRNRI